MFVATLLLGRALSHPNVHYVATLPGGGIAAALVAEFGMTALLMSVVLAASNTPRVARFTGVCAGACVMLFITFEAPISGMSLNPARSFASAVAAREWSTLWLYFVAPPLGMLAAAAVFTRIRSAPRVVCAKLLHPHNRHCIFCGLVPRQDSRD